MLEIMEINVLGDVLLDFGASGEVRTIQTFSFQGAEEILPWCIITGAAGAGDRRRNEGLRQGVGCMGDLFDPPWPLWGGSPAAAFSCFRASRRVSVASEDDLPEPIFHTRTTLPHKSSTAHIYSDTSTFPM